MWRHIVATVTDHNYTTWIDRHRRRRRRRHFQTVFFHSLAIISLTRSLLAKRVGHKPVVKPPRWLRRVGLKTEGHSCTCSCKQLKRSRSFTLLLTFIQMFFGQIF